MLKLLLLLYNEKEREKQILYFVRYLITRLRCVSHSSLSCPYDYLMYLPLKLENSWYPVLYESTNRNELALADANSSLYDLSSRTLLSISPSFPIRYFSRTYFSCSLSNSLFQFAISLSGLSAKWRKSTPFHSESRNSSNRSTAFRTIIDFRNDFGVLHKSLPNARSGV